MSQSREWSVVETLFHGALALAPEAREEWLREVTGGDTAVVAEVLALLAADAAATPGLVSAVAHDAPHHPCVCFMALCARRPHALDGARK